MTTLIVLVAVVVVVQIALQVVFMERRRRLRIALRELLATQQERDARERAEREAARLQRELETLRGAEQVERVGESDRSWGPS